MSVYTNVKLATLKLLKINFIRYFVVKVFVLQLLHLSIRKTFCAKAYPQDGTLHKKELLHVASYFPQVIVPFQNGFPEECLHFQSSDISFSCYNLTLDYKNANLNADASFQSTYVLTTVETLKRMKVFLTLGELSGITNVRYKWLAQLSEDNIHSNFTELEEMVENTSFSSVNPLSITVKDVNEIDEMTVNSGIKVFNLDTVLPQTQVQSVDSIWNFQCSLNNFLSGRTLKVAGVDHPIYEYDTKMGNDSQNRLIFVSGFAVEVLRTLQQILNFSVEAVKMDEWGYKDSDSKEWIGMVGGAIKGELDLAISSCARVASRQEVVDFNMPTHLNKLTGFFKRHSGYPLNPLLLPFHELLWFSILLWMCFCRIIYFIFQYCIKHWLNEEDESSFDDGNLFPWIVAPITSRGVPKPPKRTSLQALYFGELVVTVIINSAFSGTLIAYLSVDNNPIKTFEEMVKSDYNLEILDYKITVDDFKNSTDPLSRITYQKSQRYERPNKKTENPFTAVVGGKLAYIIHDLGGFGEMDRYLEPLDACSVQYIPMPGNILKQGTFVRKGSQLKRIIDHGLLKVMETGITIVLRKRYLPQGPKCDHPAEFSGADIYDLQLAFFVLIVSYSTAIMICILENLWFAYIRRFQVI